MLHALAAAMGMFLFARPLSLEFKETGNTVQSAALMESALNGPELTFGPTYPVTLPAGSNSCSANIPLNTDALTALLDFSLAPCAGAELAVEGLEAMNSDSTWRNAALTSSGDVLRDIPPGTYRLLVEVSDTCNGVYTDVVHFRVADEEPPLASCAKNLSSMLFPFPWPPYDKYPIDRIFASRINQGSFDQCGPLAWVKVRRLVGPEHYENLIFYGYDADGDGLITTADGIDGDYNGVLDPEEYFTPGPDGKLFTPALGYVDFFCPDVVQSPTVVLMVKDLSGNISTCFRDIQVNDAGWLRLEGPQDMEMDCNAEAVGQLIAADTFGTESYKAAAARFGDLEILGGNECAQPQIRYEIDASGMNCGSGTIIRRWSVGKNSPIGQLEQQIEQRITVRTTSNFDIFFPGDMSMEGCGAEALPIPKTTVKSRSCDTLKVTVADWITPYTPRSCDVLYRTFTVSNPCTEAETCTEILTIERNLPAIQTAITSGKGFFVLIRDLDADGIQEVYLSLDSIPEPSERGAYLPQCSDGRFYGFRFTQVINMGDGVAPVIPAVPSFTFPARWTDCRGDVEIRFRAQDNCTEPLRLSNARIGLRSNPNFTSDLRWYDASLRQFGRDSFAVTIRNLTTGQYQLLVQVQDACGNQSAPVFIPFDIQDQTAPTPFCQAIRTVNLNADGQVVLPFWELLAGKTFDCSGQIRDMTDPGNPVRTLVNDFSVNRKGETPNRFRKSLTFDCADAGKLIDVELHAWDAAGNHHFCQAKVQVQAPGLTCAEGANSIGNNGGIPQWNLSNAEKAFLKVSPNFPNPFADQTSLKFYLPEDGRVILTIHDLYGRMLFRQESDFQQGEYLITLPGDNLPAGVLIGTLEAPGIGQQQTFRMQKVE